MEPHVSFIHSAAPPEPNQIALRPARVKKKNLMLPLHMFCDAMAVKLSPVQMACAAGSMGHTASYHSIKSLRSQSSLRSHSSICLRSQ